MISTQYGSSIMSSLSNPSVAISPAKQPEVQDLYDQLTSALEHLRGEVSAIDEKLGYIQLPAPSQDGSVSPEKPQPDRSPLAHNLYCLLCGINDTSYRLNMIRLRLQI